MQARKGLDEYLNDNLVNKLIKSEIPNNCKLTPCILGIDEAGRGPVLGPMTYAIAYYPQKSEEVLAKMKFADSKVLTETARENLFESLESKQIGYMIKIISPNMISNSMLRRKKYNLNALSHDTAIDLIKSIQDAKIVISHVYIDTVGPPDKYKEKMLRFFPKLNFTIAEKADSKYPIVSAASVCAKVMRDRIVQNWNFLESSSLHLDAFELGSGYPADPGTKHFLEKSIDPVFGYPTLARFSWSTIVKLLDSKGCKCDWNEPEDDVQDSKQLTKQQQFFKRFVTKKAQPAKGSRATTNPTKDLKNRTNADSFFDSRHLTTLLNWPNQTRQLK